METLKKLILTEKPSVAQDFAKALNATNKKNYYENSEYYITWAFGHLLNIDDKIAPPDWNINNLPIFPDKFLYKEVTPLAKKQLSLIKDLLQKSNKVIICTDAGREGELIARLILQHSGWKNWENTYRFWTSEALTPDIIKKEISNLKPASSFDSLYFSALARQHADWLVGINLTRLVTLKTQINSSKTSLTQNSIWSIGRVQTPTLALIVKREKEIENFKPEPYFLIKAKFQTKDNKFYEGVLKLTNKSTNKSPEPADNTNNTDNTDITNNTNNTENPDIQTQQSQIEHSQYGIKNEKDALKILAELNQTKTGIIENIEIKRKKEPPPLLHSLTSLQREANSLYGFSAAKTLNIAQKLYEEYKCISYPRTDARHLATSSHKLVLSILKKLNQHSLCPSVNPNNKRIFDDTKLTDHHAIIPLSPLPENATPDETKIYNLITRKFIGAFMPDYIYEQIKIHTKVKNYLFETTGIKDIQLGWKSLYKEENQESKLPQVKLKENVTITKIWSEKKFTQPPPRYSEATLLKEMEKLGLGTPATRASIIENLKNKYYITLLKAKQLSPTPKAILLIEKLKNSLITSPEMTSQWEKELELIYKNKKNKQGYINFINNIKNFVNIEIEKIKKIDFSSATPLTITNTSNYTKHRKFNYSNKNSYQKSYQNSYQNDKFNKNQFNKNQFNKNKFNNNKFDKKKQNKTIQNEYS